MWPERLALSIEVGIRWGDQPEAPMEEELRARARPSRDDPRSMPTSRSISATSKRCGSWMVDLAKGIAKKTFPF